MGSTPQAPDPYKTASAQSNANFVNAQQNFGLQNVNENTPYGSKSYAQTGWNQIYDPNTRKYVQSPQYTSNVTLSPGEQGILDKNTQLRGNIADIGTQQSARLLNHLGQPISTQGLQGWNAGPQAPGLATSFGGNNPMQMSLAGGGPIQRGYNAGGPIQRNVAGGGNILSGWGNSGLVQRGIAGQDVRQDQLPTDRAAIERAMLQRYERNAAPRQAAEEAQMANRGMSPGSAGYGSMQDARGRERTEAETNAFLASGQESRAAQDAYNQAAQQRFGQGAAQGAFANQAQQQVEDQKARAAGFANAAEQQRYNEQLSQGQFANQAQQAANQQNVQAGAFANQATAQQFGQGAAQGAFANQAQQAAYNQAQGRAGFGNEAQQAMFGMGGQAADRQNALRGTQWQERLSERNQPINEIMALLGGAGVNTPQFQPFQGSQMQAPNIGQMIYDQYNAKSQQAQNNMSGMFGLGGAVAGALPWASWI